MHRSELLSKTFFTKYSKVTATVYKFLVSLKNKNVFLRNLKYVWLQNSKFFNPIDLTYDKIAKFRF